MEQLEYIRKEAINVISGSHAVSIDATNAAALQSLLESTKSLTESVNGIVEILGREAPWQRECDAALRQIQVQIFLFFDCFCMALSFFYFWILKIY